MTEQRGHITLSELQGRIENAVTSALPLPLWVCAEIAEMKVNYSGHCYLELVEKSDDASNGTATAQARGVIWRTAWPGVESRFRRENGTPLAVGMKILVKALVTYHRLYGLSLQITDIDPSYTLGDMERRRRMTIEMLQRDGVWDLNRSLPMPEVVQRIAVVSSATAAGLRDFLRQTERSPYAFRIELFEAVMQGTASSDSIADALAAIAEREQEFDAVAIIRGGGGASDLSCYDSYMLASAVAQFPLPVITGIGHDKDISVTDMVANTMLKTPTAVAVWLNDRAAAFDAGIEAAAARLNESCIRLTHIQSLRLQSLALRCGSAAGARISSARTGAEMLEKSLKRFAESALQREEKRLDSCASITANFAPQRLMRLGFGIARMHGKALRSTEGLHKGDVFELEMCDGTVSAEITGIGTGKES